MVQSALIAMLSALIVSIIALLAGRRMSIAQANSTTSGEWKRLYDEMKDRVKQIEKKLHAIEIKYDCSQKALETAWAGHQENIKQLYQLEQVPRHAPSFNEFFSTPKE